MLRRLALATALILLTGPVSLARGESDFVRRQVPGGAPPPPFQPEFQFSFGTPARWPGKVLHWHYNHGSAPIAPSPFADEGTAVAALAAAAAKWSAVCGIQFVYDGPTAVPPYNGSDPKPDNYNVVGWRELTPGTLGLTYTWNAAPPDQQVLVDADILFTPSRFSAPPPSANAQMDRTGTHEWGHAIGIGHSNLPDQLMSGLPDSPYSSVSDPQPDDIRACRCLYGAAGGQSAAYACSLPALVDFGAQTVGVLSAAQTIDVVNDATATLPLTVGGSSSTSPEFFVSGGTCGLGALMPGAGCKVAISARPVLSGTRNGELVIATSDGPYRVPLTMDGYAPPVPPVTYNYQGLWWASPANSEAGWGLNVAHQGDTLFVSWFTYDTSGRGSWLVMTATKSGPNAYTGTLYRTRGPAFNAVPWSPADVTKEAAGSATLTFGDTNNGTFAYTVSGVTQTKPITREVFGPVPTCTWGGQPDLTLATNYQDLWWAAPAGTESGWGINLNHQGGTIFATWFTYDLDGTPLWLVVTAPETGANVYGGDLYRTTGPPFSALPFDPAAVVATKAGTATFTFTDGNHATFAYSVQLGGMAEPVAQSKPITRQVFAPPGTACR